MSSQDVDRRPAPGYAVTYDRRRPRHASKYLLSLQAVTPKALGYFPTKQQALLESWTRWHEA